MLRINRSGLILFFIPLILVLLYFFHPIPLQNPNSDIGEHLLMGKIIIDNHSVPHTNLLSFTYPDYPFINTTWLSDVVLYLCQKQFGFPGLIVLSLILVAVSFFILLKIAIADNPKILPIFATTFLYLPLLSQRSQVRPELFSYLFLSLFLFILFTYRKKYSKHIFLLIPLELLWVNFHIYFIIGLILIGLFLLEMILKKYESIHPKKIIALAVVFVFTFLVTFINPNGINGAFYPLFFFNNYGFDVIENMNFFKALISYFDISFVFYSLSIILLFGMSFLSINKVPKIGILISVSFTILGLFAMRNSGLFFFGTFISFYTVMKNCEEKYLRKNIINAPHVRYLVLLSLFIFSMYAFSFHNRMHGIGMGIKDDAKEAADFIKDNHILGPIYNNYNIGSYLDYRLYPDIKVFVDGRPEAYPKEFFEKEYYPMELSYDIFQKSDSARHFNIIFYQHHNQTKNNHSLLLALTRSRDWKMVYLDSYNVIFLKNTDRNKNIISQYAISEENVKVRDTDFNNQEKVGQMSDFFRVVGWYKPMLKMDIRYLDFDPSNCISLRHIAAVMQQTNNPMKDIYVNRYTTNCIQ